MFLAATNRKSEQKLFKLWSFLIVFLIINIFYNWRNRRKAVNTVIQQHPQGPGFFLSFSSAIFIQTVVGLGSQSCPRFSILSSHSQAWLFQQHIICSPSSFTKQKGMLFLIHNLFYRAGKPVIEVLQPKADFPSGLIDQICVTCPLLN